MTKEEIEKRKEQIINVIDRLGLADCVDICVEEDWNSDEGDHMRFSFVINTSVERIGVTEEGEWIYEHSIFNIEDTIDDLHDEFSELGYSNIFLEDNVEFWEIGQNVTIDTLLIYNIS